MFDEKKQGKVVVLGKGFANDEDRRAYFRAELRKKLPELKKMEGFPIGTEDDIIALSDPPYYTVCPNPWIADFVREWESEKPAKPKNWHYSREPFAADVSEGKNDPIYNAHSYHTKVPPKAIMRYILHYTEPGDIIFDGFCGSGMTGVAAQMCGDPKIVEALGYRVDRDGTVSTPETDEAGHTVYVPFSRLGPRRAVLNDLSPAATFIAYNYDTAVDTQAVEQEARRVLAQVKKECGWMYETKHTDERVGIINYCVWSDVFVCPSCGKEVVFYDVAVDEKAGNVLDEFHCVNCDAVLTKRSLQHAWIVQYDNALMRTLRQTKQVPVLINYTIDGKRFDKIPDSQDLALLEKIAGTKILYWFPTDRMMEGRETRRNDPTGLTHVPHFFTKRTLSVLSGFSGLGREINSRLLWCLTAVMEGSSKLNRERPFGLPSKLSGTLYVSSMVREINVLEFLSRKIAKYETRGLPNGAVISCCSSARIGLKDASQDYLFLDPPFGSNLNYSELNFIWESWLRAWTNNSQEAIVSDSQGKGLSEYRQLMTACFKEAYRVLKAGHWMTIEFSNTQSSVWNSIQTALSDVGFIVANVSALDKQQGSFKAVTTTTAVKQDLVISAYKPETAFENRFHDEAPTTDGVWDFVRTHLKYLPATKGHGAELQTIPERDPRTLFDRMVAYYVRSGFSVPLSTQDFQKGLSEHFVERDGMIFLEDQVAEYDRKRLAANRVVQEELFVTNEAQAIAWLRRELGHERQTYSDIVGHYMQELQHLPKHEKLPELQVLLDENFLQDEKGKWYVPDPHKESDLQKLRDKHLLKEFELYRQEVLVGHKKLKVFRTEALRAGFKQCWEDKMYATITLMAEQIPSNVLEEDPQLLMYYDNAQMMQGK